VRILRFEKPHHREALVDLFTAEIVSDTELESQVRRILDEVRTRGDAALISFARKFDGVTLAEEELVVSKSEFEEARDRVSEEFLTTIARAKRNIERFHRRQIEESWESERDGVRLAQRVLPIEAVGIYVPGGQALYPSTVLMTAIPARLAGVPRLVMVTPPQQTGVDPHLLVAAHLAGIDEVYQVGGAQAIAALAFGTLTIPRVDKIVGPGNIYVAEAKRQLFGLVDIDSIAGPSEIAVLADDSADPQWIATDLIAQLEHDAMAKGVLVTPSAELAHEVAERIRGLVHEVPRSEIVGEAVKHRTAAVIARSLDEAIEAVNLIAPEHVEVMTESPRTVAERITHAGCIFVGPYSPVPLGDYIAGTNHTLPTGRTARFGSPLGVYDFYKRISVVEYTKEAFLRESGDVEILAGIEDLPNHATAVRVRREAE
jgi:histidinol dehydrogenase